VERGVLSKPEIEERLKKFVRARLWNNDKDPRARSAEWAAMLQKRFGTSGIPLYVALTPDDRVLGTLTFQGGSADAFRPKMAAWLDEMLEKAGK
jgi:hypothetical protein